MAGVWHWLVQQGQLYHALVSWAMGFLMGGITARLGISRLAKAWHRHIELQERQANLLNTQTPGGLGTVVKVIEESNKEEQ